LLVRKYTYCLSPIEAISIYGAKMNMDFIAWSIEKRMISYLDKQWLWDGIPFSVSQLKYFRAIVNTKNLDIQLPYKHIVDMVQRALDLYPYPTTDTIKYLVGFYDLLDDIHKAIVEPSLYKHCHREASFDHFRI
jgi:adenylate kinase family enzyme